MQYPSPSRRPPAPPQPSMSGVPMSKVIDNLPGNGFDDFNFKLGRSPQQNTSAMVPLIVDNPPSQVKSVESSTDRRVETENAPIESSKTTSTDTPDRRQSVRARRKPADSELTLAGSPKQHSRSDFGIDHGVAEKSDSGYSLFPIKGPDRTRTPALSGSHGLHTPRVQNLIDAERIMTSSPSAPTVLPPTPNSEPLQPVSDRILNLPLPIHAPPTSNNVSTATNTSFSPTVPPRSVDRQSQQRPSSKRLPLESSGVKPGPGSRDSAQDPLTLSQTSFSHTELEPGPSSAPSFTLFDTQDQGLDSTVLQTFGRESNEVSISDVPSTPRMAHKRNSSIPVSPNSRGRHAASKSVESSLQHNGVGLGSPVTSFENDLSRAFNLSPSAPSSFPGSNGALLERSNTISRLANKMMKHRKSVSGSALSPRTPVSHRRGSVPDMSLDVATLQEELRMKNDRISLLEESIRHVNESKSIERKLEARKSLLATIESQIVESGAEHQSYLHHRHSASDTKVPLGTWKAKVVADMDESIRKAKEELSAEIATLIRERNDLQLENETLISQKSSHIQDIAILEKRHQTLTTMNDSMLRQIQTGMEANKTPKPVSQGRSEFSLPSPGTSPSVKTQDAEEKTAIGTPDKESMYLLSNSTSRDLQNDAEEEIVVGSAIKRLSSERVHDTASPKKLNLVKKTKRAFRWGRNGNNVQEGSYGTSLNGIPPSERTMSSSRSTDKLSTKSGGGMFKRSWQSQQNLASHLDSSRRDSSSQYTPVAMFGNDLTMQLESEGRLVPQVVTSCITIIESRALEFEGLYRKSGGAGEMKALIEAFETANCESNAVDFTSFQDISAITSVLKQYLRRLPIPLINFDAYEPFLGTSAIPDPGIRIRAVQDVLRDLPPPHYQTLRVLFKHLLTVSQHCDKNLMTTKNLAVVLGPTVIWDQAGDKEISDMHDKNSCIQFCIEHADQW